jgi:hypothetical protein
MFSPSNNVIHPNQIMKLMDSTKDSLNSQVMNSHENFDFPLFVREVQNWL